MDKMTGPYLRPYYAPGTMLGALTRASEKARRSRESLDFRAREAQVRLSALLGDLGEVASLGASLP